jgi:hypothetical protein
VAHQARARELADQFGYVEPHLWTGVGRARSGCGAALVGSVDQVLSEIEAYRKMGIRAFIFSGYPHLDECRIFGRGDAASEDLLAARGLWPGAGGNPGHAAGRGRATLMERVEDRRRDRA